MIKLSLCQNDYLMGGTFWEKDSFFTHILFELWLIMIFRPVANFVQQSIFHRKSAMFYVLYFSVFSPEKPDDLLGLHFCEGTLLTQFWHKSSGRLCCPPYFWDKKLHNLVYTNREDSIGDANFCVTIGWAKYPHKSRLITKRPAFHEKKNIEAKHIKHCAFSVK